MNYKHSCVIDSTGAYKTLVLVLIELDDGGQPQDVIQHYTLADGEQLADTAPPSVRPYAGAEGFIIPRWDGVSWVESATADEISVWEADHPAPNSPGPSDAERIAQLELQLTETQLALCAEYESKLFLQEEVTNTQLAVCDVYEQLLAKGGVS